MPVGILDGVPADRRGICGGTAIEGGITIDVVDVDFLVSGDTGSFVAGFEIDGCLTSALGTAGDGSAVTEPETEDRCDAGDDPPERFASFLTEEAEV
jgi:hypothetical protein